MKVIYDIETLSNAFSYCDINPKTLEKKEFIIHQDQNDFDGFVLYLKTLSGMIGYNNILFDAQVIQFILINKHKFKELTDNNEGKIIANEIYQFAQKTIEMTNNGGWATYPEWKFFIPQLDLFKVWHFDNKNKMTSLKWIEYMLDLPDIQEMPIHHSENVTIQQMKKMVIPYNHHDVFATHELYKITKGETDHPLYKGIDKIQLRLDVQEEFGIKCLNYNDVKIGDSINKITYSKLSGIPIKEISKNGTFRNKIKVSDCIKANIKFESLELQSFYNEFSKLEFDPLNLKKTKGKTFTFKGLTISFGFGGIHSVDKPRIIETDSEYYLTDKDCTGMYPRTIIEKKLFPEHLGEAWYRGCEYIYNERAYKYKPQSKFNSKAKSFAESYKLANNGGSFGKTNEYSSWQYDPLVTFSITITNQFLLLKFAEMMLLNNISVVSLNTKTLVF